MDCFDAVDDDERVGHILRPLYLQNHPRSSQFQHVSKLRTPEERLMIVRLSEIAQCSRLGCTPCFGPRSSSGVCFFVRIHYAVDIEMAPADQFWSW
jgi:hypothetical protein